MCTISGVIVSKVHAYFLLMDRRRDSRFVFLSVLSPLVWRLPLELLLVSDGVLPRLDASVAASMSSSRTSDSGEVHCNAGSIISVNLEAAILRCGEGCECDRCMLEAVKRVRVYGNERSIQVATVVGVNVWVGERGKSSLGLGFIWLD